MSTPPLRRMGAADFDEVRCIYASAVREQAVELYSPEQVEAWASLALLPGVLDGTLRDGFGLVSPGVSGLEAFAVLHPPERVALLYCRGRSARQGRGQQLLLALEREAMQRGCRELRTEASQLSRPLFLRLGWQALEAEQILIAGVAFERYPLRKLLPHERLKGHRPPPP
jgi:putative acetyltransferase